MLQSTYGIGRRAVYQQVASGEFFAACGARRSSVEVDPRPGGTFTTSVVSGVYAEIGPDSFGLAIDDGSHVTLTIGGMDGSGSLTITSDLVLADFWSTGLEALFPPVGRQESDATERQTYDDWLDYYRTQMRAKLAGVSEADARRSYVGSATTLLGLAKHLVGVERYWFQVVLGERTRDDVGPNNSGGDDSWVFGPDDTIESILAEYDVECARSRQRTVRHELTDTVPHERAGRISLRMILVHMIEETARHLGHADILRELIDGKTGNLPE
jgi:uncharacterized damage-inducible protein DinB